MRTIEFCIPSLAFIFGLLLTTHLVQPVQDWVLGVEIFGSVLFFPHAVRVLTAWLYVWKSIFFADARRYSRPLYAVGAAGVYQWRRDRNYCGSCNRSSHIRMFQTMWF